MYACALVRIQALEAMLFDEMKGDLSSTSTAKSLDDRLLGRLRVLIYLYNTASSLTVLSVHLLRGPVSP